MNPDQGRSLPDFPRRAVPPMAQIRQNFPSRRIDNVRTETRRKLLDAGLGRKIKPGDRIAITAGSRAMGGFLDLLIVDELGKTISGTGMDLNVVGNWRLKGGPRNPD